MLTFSSSGATYRSVLSLRKSIELYIHDCALLHINIYVCYTSVWKFSLYIKKRLVLLDDEFEEISLNSMYTHLKIQKSEINFHLL